MKLTILFLCPDRVLRGALTSWVLGPGCAYLDVQVSRKAFSESRQQQPQKAEEPVHLYVSWWLQTNLDPGIGEKASASPITHFGQDKHDAVSFCLICVHAMQKLGRSTIHLEACREAVLPSSLQSVHRDWRNRLVFFFGFKDRTCSDCSAQIESNWCNRLVLFWDKMTSLM